MTNQEYIIREYERLTHKLNEAAEILGDKSPSVSAIWRELGPIMTLMDIYGLFDE